MKLSEAMMLGSTTCRMIPGDWNSCALGAALNAIGVPQQDALTKKCPRSGAVKAIWPWLASSIPMRQPDHTYPDQQEVYGFYYHLGSLLPHSLPYSDPTGQIGIFGTMITYLFDYEVCRGKLSFENLVRLVQEWEPEERMYDYPFVLWETATPEERQESALAMV